MNALKNKQISESLAATRLKRSCQDCKVFEVKIDESQLNRKTKRDLKRLFLEAKWLYNYALSQEDLFNIDYKIKTIPVLVKDVYEDRELNVISSQIKQSVIEKVKTSILNLSKTKNKGKKVGSLKYKSYCKSIDLKQYGNTYQIKKNRVKIQGIKQWMTVRGLNQLQGDVANAKLVQKPGGYYLKITCYIDRQVKADIIKPPIGIDFGIKTQLTLSNGIEIAYKIEVATKRKRRTCRSLSKKKRHSGNWYKQAEKLRKEYEGITNQKKDIKNKILNILREEYGTIVYQNDYIAAWQRLWGKRLLNTAIGGITAELKKLSTSVEVDRFYASTKECPICKHKQDIGLEERMYHCDNCGYEKPRDWKSALCILNEGLKKIGVEYTESTPVERKASTLMVLERFNAIPCVKASLLIDAGSLRT